MYSTGIGVDSDQAKVWCRLHVLVACQRVCACLCMHVLIVGVLLIMQYGVLSNLIIYRVWNILINTEAVIVFSSLCFLTLFLPSIFLLFFLSQTVLYYTFAALGGHPLAQMAIVSDQAILSLTFLKEVIYILT